jgi:hypothetical protein
MIHVCIQWPVGEDYVGTLLRQDLQDLVHTGSSEIRRPINLSGEARFCSQNLASRLAFSATDLGGFIVGLALNPTLASGEINDCRDIAQLLVEGQRAGATGFGIIRMTADTNHL